MGTQHGQNLTFIHVPTDSWSGQQLLAAPRPSCYLSRDGLSAASDIARRGRCGALC
jgi:hypothetical protein